MERHSEIYHADFCSMGVQYRAMNIEHYYDKPERIWRMKAVDEEGQRLGGLFYTMQRDELKLCYLYVKETNKGIGRALLEQLVHEAEEHHVATITGTLFPFLKLQRLRSICMNP